MATNESAARDRAIAQNKADDLAKSYDDYVRSMERQGYTKGGGFIKSFADWSRGR